MNLETPFSFVVFVLVQLRMRGLSVGEGRAPHFFHELYKEAFGRLVGFCRLAWIFSLLAAVTQCDANSPAGGGGVDRALLLSKQGLGGNEASAVQRSLLLPGVLLIGALSSQGVVSKSFCHISMGLLLPTGKAISWEAWGGAGEAVPVPCSA